MKAFMARMMEHAGLADSAPSYEETRDLARDPDSAVRRRLAARQDVRPEILYYLAEDVAPEVRLEIAANAATPAQANLLLARDADEQVRCELAGKIAKLMPHLSADDQDKLRDITIKVLEILARDQLSRVRQILAETLKDTGHAPAHVIRWLSRDMDVAVAAPVLQFSPLLSDTDLVEIIESRPVQGALGAIARRKGLSAGLCDAIVTTDDKQAIADLLGNSSAQVREETLDYMAERAREVISWQPPFVHRLRLPRAVVRKLAGFVTDSLLSVLAQRKDLPPDVLQEVAAVVRQRVAADDTLRPEPKPSVAEAEELLPDGPLDHQVMLRKKGTLLAQYVQQLYAKGQLNEDTVAEALSLGNQEFVVRALALKAGVAPTLVSRVIAARSAKGITALAWKAGLSMRFAIKLQIRIAHVAAGDALNAKDGTDYPMSAEEMERLIRSFSE